MAIDPKTIRELREKSGAGILDCKTALTENNNDISKAIDWLRKKGLSVAAKKSDRVAAEGLVGTFIDGKVSCLVEINSETDFVSRNEKFQNFVKNCSKLGLESNGEIDNLKKMKYLDSDNNVEEELTKNISIIGENINIRRIEILKLEGKGLILSYVHNAVSENLGKIGVLLALESDADLVLLNEFGKRIAMHIAASNPLSININDLDIKIIEREKNILLEQSLASGKPKDIAEKMVEGRIKKFYQDVVLEEQSFVIDGKTPVKEILQEFARLNNCNVEIKGFKKFILGDGIQLDEKDFVAEVAATVNK